jgi:hypothetical protein
MQNRKINDFLINESANYTSQQEFAKVTLMLMRDLSSIKRYFRHFIYE